MLFAGTASAQELGPQSSVSQTSVAAQILNASDIALYRERLAAARAGQITRSKSLLAKVSDTTLQGYVEAEQMLAPSGARTTLPQLTDWLKDYRELAIADRVYRLAVQRSTRTVRRGGKRVRVAVVTGIPAPAGVGTRSGGFEDAELPEPNPRGEAGRAVLSGILADIKDGNPDAAVGKLDSVRASATPTDIAILTHRIAASFLAEGRNSEAYALATSVSDASVPQLRWDAGFAAYRMGQWDNAITHLEALAQSAAAQNTLRAQGAFWSARAHMRTGDPAKVVTLLSFAAKQNPSFYGIIAERALGIDIKTGFSDAVLTASDFADLMRAGGARRAVALWQIGQTEHVGPELNRAFVQNDERLDPAMAALARAIGVPNVELRASEKSAARGVLLTGLFPVPPYAPADGYRIDHSLVLAFARIESRFQTGATSPVGARGLMQVMPATARALGVKDPSVLNDPSVALSVGQKYIVQLLDNLGGNLMALGGAYNAGPGAVNRWRETKAGGDDPLLFVESIPVFETRSYVKRLMLYHWMYRRRFNEETPSLEQTARGQWPIYNASNRALPTLASTPATPAVADTARPAAVQVTTSQQ